MISPSDLALVAAVVLAAMIGVMAVAWLLQRAAGNSGWVDVLWTFGTGVTAAAAAEWAGAGEGLRTHLVAAMAGLWALRLGGFIAQRVAGSAHEDTRYAELRRDWGKHYQVGLFLFLMIQPFVSAVLAVAVALAAAVPDPALGLRDLAAAGVWLLAVLGETLADGQMARFRRDPANKGRVCERGLWGWSRHPNYFFEWLGWFAYPVIAFSATDRLSWLSLGAPVVMYLILRFGSGVPPLERSMLASRGWAFRDYQSRVSAFIPLPPRRAKHPRAPESEAMS